ncbi:MAG: hypothetical protein K6B28_00775 [Lachnospiraceae bacterium]|nr:hypothetical protein [Lachnospiraceae bacterium]
MIVFELYKQLDIRLYDTIKKIDENLKPCGKYLLEDDCLVMLGSNRSVRINITEKKIEADIPYRNYDIDISKLRWFSRESKEGCLIRMICNSLREWYEIDPFKSFMEFEGLLIETNKRLIEYGLSIFWDKKSMFIYREEKLITFEEALSLLLDIDETYDAKLSLTEWQNDARYYKMTGQEAEAIKQYEMLLRYTDRTMEMYTDAAFSLGELYYFNENYERAIEMYKRCDLRFIANARDLYVHIGHVFLDVRMKNFVREIKIYYRSLIDPYFAERNRRAVEVASEVVLNDYEEYEDACYQVGFKKYNEYQAMLPMIISEDDDFIITDKNYEPVIEIPKKRYEDIKLIPTTLIEGNDNESREELLFKALNYLNEGEYQKAFLIYLRLSREATESEQIYTWANLQLGKLYVFFNEYENAITHLDNCREDMYGVLYRKDDQRLLSTHARIVMDDFESEERFRILIRGKYDNYYAAHDKEYFFLKKNKELMENFQNYEKECIEQAERRILGSRKKIKKKKNEWFFTRKKNR